MTTYITVAATARRFVENADARPHVEDSSEILLPVERVTVAGATRVTSSGATRVISRNSTIYALELSAQARRFTENTEAVNFTVNAKARRFVEHAEKVNE